MTTTVPPEHDTPGINFTTFAYSMTAALAETLDGLVEIGSKRYHRMAMARDFANDAVKFAGTPEEEALARQFKATLRFFQQRGWDV